MCGYAAAVGEDLAMVVEFLVENHDQFRRLDDLERFRDGERFRDAVWQTSLARHSLATGVSPSLVQRLGPWLEQHFGAGGEAVRPTRCRHSAAWPPPDAG